MAPYDTDALIVQIAQILEEAIEFATSFSEQYGSEPLEDSLAHREMSGQSGAAGSLTLTSDDVYKAYSQGAGICIPAAEQFMIAMRQLYVTPMSIFGYQTVARSLVETSAKAWWLIDPNIDLPTRMARHYVDLLENIYDVRKLEASEGTKSMYDMRIRGLLDTTSTFGLRATYAKRKDGSDGDLIGFNSVVPAKATDLVNDFFAAISFSDGDRWYRIVSGVAHGGAHGLLRHFDIRWADKPYRASLAPRLDREEISNFAVLAIHSYLGAVQAHAEAFGQDHQLVERTRTAYHERIRKLEIETR
jgi:hypothetical protein